MMDLARRFPQGVYARRIVRDVLPTTDAELTKWQRRIARIPNVELQRQAWASVATKRFHAEGGSVYAALAPDSDAALVPLIVALQTISDYLDNLCDRSVSMDEADFRQLHEAMLDATDPSRPPADYYARHPNKDDGGYLQALVEACREGVAALPSYPVVKPYVLRLVALYNDLQVYKHGPLPNRVPALTAWFDREKKKAAQDGSLRCDDLFWWEFAAASGSTLSVFALFAAAARPDLSDHDARRLVASYFPAICGMHILLDYFIDQAEDEAGGDLNLVRFYPSPDDMSRRLVAFVARARREAARLPDPAFHTTIVQGLPGLYLSDGKVAAQGFQPVARRLLRTAGPASFLYYVWCRLRRALDPAAQVDPRPAPCDRPAFGRAPSDAGQQS